MSDTENKCPKWHLKSRTPVHGMDVDYVLCCDSCKEIILEKSIRPSPPPKKNKGTKNKPR